MTQSCHNSDLGINFLTEISPHEVSWDEHRLMLNPLKFSITTPLNSQNMQTELTAVQVF